MEEIKTHYFILKKNGASRQLQALEKPLGLAGAGSKNEASGMQPGLDSAADTPALTSETNSPQSSSPRSAHANDVSIPAEHGGNGGNETCGKLSNGVTPQMQEEAS